MEYQQITNLLDTKSDKVPRFNTKKWIEVHDQSGKIYNTNKQIRFKTSMLRSELCNYIDTYIGVYILELLMLQIRIIMHMIKN